MPQVFDFLDDVIIELQLDQLVEAYEVIDFQNVLIRQQLREIGARTQA